MAPETTASHVYDVISHGQSIFLEHHVPEIVNDPYHTHPSIEMNYLRGCEMTYSFSGQTVTIPEERFCIFWAAYPHRPASLTGKGLITNAYISLQQFLDFSLSAELVEQIFAGALICAKEKTDNDRVLFDRLAGEIAQEDENWERLHRQEIHARLTRLDLEGWEVISPPQFNQSRSRIGGAAIVHFDKMLRYIAHYAFEPITVKDVADAAGISTNYAIILFRKMLGVTVKGYLMDLRIHHAKMMLHETNEKILNVALDCGFGSLSSFYEAFGAVTGMSPAAYRNAHDRKGS